MCKEKLAIVAVYGTLKSDGRLYNPEEVICKSKDKVAGVLFNIEGVDWPFPGIHLGGDKEVEVELQVVRQDYIDYLDLVEGGMYKRRQIVTLGGTPCYIYECLLNYEPEALISNGIWVN